MGSDVEAFCCEILNTQYMTKLLFHTDKLENYKDVVDILFNWEKFNNINEIKELNNVHINNAIKEIENK